MKKNILLAAFLILSLGFFTNYASANHNYYYGAQISDSFGSNLRNNRASSADSGSGRSGAAAAAAQRQNSANSTLNNLLVKNRAQFGDPSFFVINATEKFLRFFSGSLRILNRAGKTVFTILDNGKVGIGVENPEEELAVGGNIIAKGSIAIGEKFVFGGRAFITVCPIAGGLFALSTSETCPGGGGGDGTLTVSTDPDNVLARYLVMGTNNTVYKLRLAAGDTAINFGGIAFTSSNSQSGNTLTNFSLYEGDNLLAGPVNLVGGRAVFGGDGLTTVAANERKTLTLKTDARTLAAGAVSGSVHKFGVLDNDIKSDAQTIVGLPTSGTDQTVYRSKPTLSSSILGNASDRVRTAVDDLAALTWGAHSAGDVRIQSVRLTFAGAAIDTPVTSFTVSVIDPATNTGWDSSTPQTCTPSGAPRICSVNFLPDSTVPRGTTKTTKLRVNSSGFADAANSQDGLSVAVKAAGNILWSDGTTNNIVWEAYLIPITIVNVAYY